MSFSMSVHLQKIAAHRGLGHDLRIDLVHGAPVHQTAPGHEQDLVGQADDALLVGDDEDGGLLAVVDIAEGVLRDVLDEDIIRIASAHHERLDGSGYPKGLKEFEMTIPQQILQVADMITGLINDRPYKPALKKEAVIAILQQEVSKHKLSKQIVETVIVKYDEIIKKVKTESEKILTLQNRLISQYEQVKVKFAG